MNLFVLLLSLRIWAFYVNVVIVVGLNVTELDCNMRKLAFQFAKKIQPWRTISLYRDIHDALRVEELCHESLLRYKHNESNDDISESSMSSSSSSFCQNENCVFVNPNTTNVILDGSMISPVMSIEDALILTRSRKRPSIIVLRHGIHTIEKIIHFDSRDEGLKLIGYPGEQVWISGGIPLSNLHWKSYTNADNHQKSFNILVTDLTEI
jgi:hypothetical protein